MKICTIFSVLIFFSFAASTAFCDDEQLRKEADRILTGEYERAEKLYSTILYYGLPGESVAELVQEALLAVVEEGAMERLKPAAAAALDLLGVTDDSLQQLVYKYFWHRFRVLNEKVPSFNEAMADRLGRVRFPNRELVSLAVNIVRYAGDKTGATKLIYHLLQWATMNPHIKRWLSEEKQALNTATSLLVKHWMDKIEYYQMRSVKGSSGRAKTAQKQLDEVIEYRRILFSWWPELGGAVEKPESKSDLAQLQRTALLERLRAPQTVLETARLLVAIDDLDFEILAELSAVRRSFTLHVDVDEEIERRLTAYIEETLKTDPLSACFLLLRNDGVAPRQPL